MRNISVDMNCNNHFSIGHCHVFINFTKSNLTFINSLPKNAVRKIHVFITNHESINYHLRELIDRYTPMRKNDKIKTHFRIILHLSKGTRDLIPLFKDFFKKEIHRVYWSVDKHDVLFYDIKKTYKAAIEYRKDFLRIKFGGKGYPSYPIHFNEYPYGATPSSDKDSSGIFKSAEHRLHPEMFKDQLIEAFKKQAPEGILKSFKSDDDIWSFIMENAEIKTKEE